MSVDTTQIRDTTAILDACQVCGTAVRVIDPRAERFDWPTNVGVTVDAYRCGDCAGLKGDLSRWRAAVDARFPEWKTTFPWEAVHARRVKLPPFPAYISDASELGHKPPQPPFWHISDERIAELRARVERGRWPSGPTPPGAGDPDRILNAPAVAEWPNATACWWCGIPTDSPVVVESPSPTLAWERGPMGGMPTSNQDEQALRRARQGAPRAPGAAWRVCRACASISPADQARRICGADPPDLDVPWADAALT